jgi:pyridoxamine 5'-phosphate oxidase
MSATRLQTLADIEAAIWRELAAAVQHKAHPWRVAVLATADGEGADARSVVLREWDADTRTLLIFTDSRSPKAQQVLAHPQGTLVLWSQPLGWQLRLRVLLELETAGLRLSSRWARLKLTPAAQDYLSPLPPGSVLNSPAPERESREHFAMLAARVQWVDWLELHASGHRRARFTAGGAEWLTP